MPPKTPIQKAGASLAQAALAGDFSVSSVQGRIAKHFMKSWSGIGALVGRVLDEFGGNLRPAERDVARAFIGDKLFSAWLHKHGDKHFDFSLTWELAMRPALGNPSTWNLPAIITPGDLAAWLGLTGEELRWMARPWRSAAPHLQHYHYHWLAKRRGGHRLIEKPKDALKLIQRKILHRVLDQIPPHDATHSFRMGRSIISFAKPHCEKAIVLSTDIAEFFPSLQRARVSALFRTVGYPDKVAALLADLCCAVVPAAVVSGAPETLTWIQQKRLRSPHLPQGAPTSPALSNLLGYRLDCRLFGLASSVGADYTRYADDIVFSGDRRVAKLAPVIHAILLEEGFQPNYHKTRLQRKGGRQLVGGIVVNSATPNIDRKTYDLMKATLHNCATRGVESANANGLSSEIFRLQLEGRISWIHQLNPVKGRKLKTLFADIVW